MTNTQLQLDHRVLPRHVPDMAKEPRKPLRERVAERKAQEAKKAREMDKSIAAQGLDESTPEGKEAIRRALMAERWKQVELAGNILQWGALLLLIAEIYFVWTADPNEETRWTWVIVYAVVFGIGRVIKTAGHAQAKLYR